MPTLSRLEPGTVDGDASGVDPGVDTGVDTDAGDAAIVDDDSAGEVTDPFVLDDVDAVPQAATLTTASNPTARICRRP
jgi:hypothetical protein